MEEPMAFSNSSGDDLRSGVRTVTARGIRMFGIGKLLLALLLAILILYVDCLRSAGHVGVLTFFGRVTGDILPEGTHFVNPFKVNNTFSVRTSK